jgi:putative PIN family toxin of toxin-antitoxin system
VSRVVVFDTNIVFSAVGWRGKPFECLELARTGIIQGFTCVELLDELSAKLQSKLSFTHEQAIATVIDLLTFLKIVPISGKVTTVVADPADDMVLECAVVAGASHLVTGDRRHLLPLKDFQGVQIVTAAEYLSLIAQI